MKVIRKIGEMQAQAQAWRGAGKRIALVPTMGYLHEGHMSLMRLAGRQADVVVVSIFVNPSQFGPNEDFDTYPRDFERDRQLCEQEGIQAIFAPEVSEMYPADASTWVVEERLSRPLCGATRPSHFRGVTTVVAKLFHAVCPQVAIFGRKDAQQLLVIERMVRDLNMPVEIVGAPIVRESDGLAMSSRNKYLEPEDRLNALSIQRGLRAAQAAYAAGERASVPLRQRVVDQIVAAGGTVDYVELVSRTDLRPVEPVRPPALLAVAAYFGRARLLDNWFID